MIHFKKITADNWEKCINLKAACGESKFIHPNVYSIAQAQFYPKAKSRAIYNDDQMIGYTMYGQDEDDKDLYYIDRLMISEDNRGRGYGYQTIEIILNQARNEGYKVVSTSTHPENEKMQKLLIKSGFYTENEIDNGEIVYTCNIK